MALAKGPESLICSARECEESAAWAIVWSNPAIHFGRSKTWLACETHRDHLDAYLKVRNFPRKCLSLAEYLDETDGRASEN